MLLFFNSLLNLLLSNWFNYLFSFLLHVCLNKNNFNISLYLYTSATWLVIGRTSYMWKHHIEGRKIELELSMSDAAKLQMSI